ncbi:MAG: FkbM family methyltransferase [Kordiimonadaceae bacterium]|nr:FkbM family methyltransferase [Kordiimonadaceae bacterium]
MLGFVNSYTKIVEAIADQFEGNPYTHIDIGCSGGMHPALHAFGQNVRAIGFDPSLSEVERLNQENAHGGIHHVAAFISGKDKNYTAKGDTQADHDKQCVTRNPWARLSVAETMRATAAESDAEKLHINAWGKTKLADPEKPIHLPTYFTENTLGSIDFIKIDVDGQDFNILKTLKEDLATRQVLGLAIEVNYVGSHLDHEHTFHNVDRFMREQGFDLFGLEVRPYSAAALPFPYRYDFPGNTIKGRPLQGDAFYFRDLCADHTQNFARNLSSASLLKAVAILSLCNLPDSSAEIVLKFRERLDEIIDTSMLLDLLATEVQVLSSNQQGMSFKDYKTAFTASDPYFWPNAKR